MLRIQLFLLLPDYFSFDQVFARALRRPALFPLPAAVVKLIFGPERAVMLLTGPRVKPVETLRYGYHFKYATIEDACGQLVEKPSPSGGRADR